MPRQAWSRAGTRIRTLMMMGVDPSKDLRNKASFVKEIAQVCVCPTSSLHQFKYRGTVT
jgi:hypothetical protein